MGFGIRYPFPTDLFFSSRSSAALWKTSRLFTENKRCCVTNPGLIEQIVAEQRAPCSVCQGASHYPWHVVLYSATCYLKSPDEFANLRGKKINPLSCAAFFEAQCSAEPLQSPPCPSCQTGSDATKTFCCNNRGTIISISE